MQRKLATWAATDPSRRIERLLRLITQPEWLAEAARITLSSKGAHTPGVDGVNKTTLQARLAVELQILRDEILSGHYQPLPARRVYIPKSNGKQRPLGIPALRDRIVQRAMLMAMEPIWESDFHTLSYGFRPERSVHHAIRTVKLQLTDCGETRGRWVIEGDLSSYFYTVHHRLLMKAVRRRISDARFMTLLWKTNKAGHIDVGLFRRPVKAINQLRALLVSAPQDVRDKLWKSKPHECVTDCISSEESENTPLRIALCSASKSCETMNGTY